MLQNRSDKVRWLEITAVLLTGLLKLVFFDIINLKLLYITLAIIFWVSFMFYRYKQDSSVLQYWGFTINNFYKTFLIVFVFATFCVVVFTSYALYTHTFKFNIHLLYSLLLYPVWGLVQQFLIMSLIAGNLKDLRNIKVNANVIIPVTAVLFSLVHYPSLWLIIGTFVLGIFYTALFLKFRNLWPLGLFHGWIGGLFYYLVLNKDPWQELFKILEHINL